MKKKIGKITAYTLCVLIVVSALFTWTWTMGVEAASPDNARIVVPLTTTLGATDGDNLYLIFFDRNTGYMAHKTTGAVALDTSWANAAVVGAKQSTEDTGTNTFVSVFDPPPLDDTKMWAIGIFENAAPANTDVPLTVVLYDPSINIIYSDTNPLRGNHVKTGG